jgi:hypothetical protein
MFVCRQTKRHKIRDVETVEGEEDGGREGITLVCRKLEAAGKGSVEKPVQYLRYEQFC